MVTLCPQRGADPRRGAALFVVLMFAAFLGGLAASAMRTGLSGARAAAVFADGIRADALGRGAADAVAYRLATGDAAAKRGGAIGLRLPGADVTIDYLSESARVDVNAAPVSLIAALLAASGAEPSEAEAAAARISAFRAAAAARAKPAQATDGTGTSPPLGGLAAIRASVDALGPAAKPKTTAGPAAIRDLSEVAAAWGLSDALARRVLPSLTVSSGAATVDPVLAGRPVLLALLGGEERADDYIQRRQAGFVDKDSALALLPVPSRDFAGFTDSPAVRAVARVRLANRYERRYEIVLAPGATATPAVSAGVVAQPSPGQPPAPVATPGAAGTAPPSVVVSWRKLP